MKYVVTVRLFEQEFKFGRYWDKHEFFECEAVSERDAKSQANWAYLREGVAVSAVPA